MSYPSPNPYRRADPPADLSDAYFVGWACEPWQPDLLPEPEAPSNYVKKEAIDAYVEKKKAEQAQKCGAIPFAGRLNDVAVLRSSGESALVDAGVPAYLALLTVLWPDPDLDPADHPPDPIVGFGVETAVALAAAEAAAGDLLEPAWLPKLAGRCVDPHRLLVPYGQISPDALCYALGVPMRPIAHLPEGDPLNQARRALLVCKKAGFL